MEKNRIMDKKLRFVLAAFTALMICVVCAAACKKGAAPAGGTTLPPGARETPPPVDTSGFARGADVSWITQMEAGGMKFYTRGGVQQDIIQVLKGLGMNSIRLRVWVNP